MSWILGCFACLCCDCLCCQCNCLIFPKPRCSYEVDNQINDPSGVSMKMQNFTQEGRSIPFVEISNTKSRKSKKCCIFFHGNAQDIGLTVGFLEPIMQQTNITFYAIEYPTYGHYEKSFSALISNRIKEDSLLFYDFLIRSGRSHQDIIVMGRSIGTGGACYLSGHRKVQVLILISPFDTIKKVAINMVGCLGNIISQHFDNLQEMKKFNGKLLVIHGQHDEVIKVEHGKNLVYIYQTQNPYKNTPKVQYPHRMTHNYFDMMKDIVKPIASFLKESNIMLDQ